MKEMAEGVAVGSENWRLSTQTSGRSMHSIGAKVARKKRIATHHSPIHASQFLRNCCQTMVLSLQKVSDLIWDQSDTHLTPGRDPELWTAAGV